MRTVKFIALVFLVPVFALLTEQSFAQEGQTTEQQKMMEIYAKYGTPGEHHKLLEPGIGKWNLTATWWAEPGGDPQVSTATSECKWILGGRYLQENVSGEMDGNPFQGIGLTGYDNFKEKYFSFWIDEMSTTYMISEGTVDSSGKIFTFYGTYDDPVTGEKDRKTKSVTRIVDNNSQLYEMFEYDADGNEWKSFEVKYSRANE
jgi:hypothetical protein